MSHPVGAGQESVGSAELVAGLRAGDQHAVQTLVTTFGPGLMAAARSILGDESSAHDAVQDGVVSALKAIDTLRDPDALGPWLRRTVTNAALAHLRQRKRRRERSIDDLLPAYHDDGHRVCRGPGWTRTPGEDLSASEARSTVRDAIEQLPDRYREIIILRDIIGYDTEQTAGMLEITQNLVKVRLHRARQALRTLLEERLGRDTP